MHTRGCLHVYVWSPCECLREHVFVLLHLYVYVLLLLVLGAWCSLPPLFSSFEFFFTGCRLPLFAAVGLPAESLQGSSDSSSAVQHIRGRISADSANDVDVTALQKENAAIRESQEDMQNKLFAAEGKLKSLEEINAAKEEQVNHAIREKMELKEELSR